MSVTLDDVKLARKRAYDRVDYWIQKHSGYTIKESGIKLPRIPKDIKPKDYGEWYEYFEGLEGATTNGNTLEFVSGGYKPPNDTENPTRPTVSSVENFSEEPIGLDDDDEDDDTSPNGIDYYNQTIENAYEYGDEIGSRVEQALAQIASVTGMDEDEMGEYLEDMGDIWEDVADAYFYMTSNGYTSTDSPTKIKSRKEVKQSKDKVYYSGLETLDRAFSKLYSQFGLNYHKESWKD